MSRAVLVLILLGGCGGPTVLETRHGDESLASSITRVAGVLEGPYRLFHPGGAPHVEAHYEAGLRDGPYREFYPDGRPVVTGQYARGLRVGEWREWNDVGELRAQGAYVDGDRHGTWIRVDAAGGPAIEEIWEQGTRVARRVVPDRQ